MSEPPVDGVNNAEDPVSEPSLSSSGQRPDALVGTTLAGRFKILEPIARGGMGTVYKAEQLALGRICAVKTMLPTFDQDLTAEFHRRFFNEASVASKLTHPNTVTVFDFGNEGELYFIAMEFIEGKTLKQVLEEEGPMEPVRAMMIAMEIARSLREAHTLGVVHRDLKPANVVIVDNRDDHDTIKVLDFGLVKSVKGPNADTVTTGGLCVGSPSYMAPEQVDGDDVTPATDIYSLGVVLFEMLCGRPPFVKTSKYSLVMAHLSEEPPSLSDLMPAGRIPRGLDDVVARCLEKEPKDRFADLEQFLSELQRIARGKEPLSTTMMKLRRTGSGEHPRTGSSGPREFTPSETPRATTTGASVMSTRETERPQANRRRHTVAWLVGGVALLAVGGVAAHFAFGDADAELPSLAVLSAAAAEEASSSATPEVSVAPSEVAPTATSRKVHIATTPEGVKVEEGAKTLCESTPCDIELGLDGGGRALAHELKLTLAGYRSTTVKVAPSEEAVKVELNRIAVGGYAPAAPATTKPAATGFDLSPY